MALIPKQFKTMAVNNSGETIFTFASGDIVKELDICNNTGAEDFISIWRVDNGGGNTDENIKYNETTIPANKTKIIHVWWPMDETGDFIYAKTKTVTDALTISIEGLSKT